MRVTLHDYVTDPSLPQKDGVNLAHENIASLLRVARREGLQVTFHDFNRLATDREYATEVLSNTDCVVSNVGPHAHYYFHWRDQLGLDFRIVRDVRTAIWSSYLFQEHLCAPYLREGDVLLVASEYTRGIYEKMFPHLASLPTVRCYPMTVGFPAGMPPRASRRARAEGAVFTLGYIGRLSEDKNFPDVVELLIFLNRRHPGRYRLLACGDVHSPSCDPQQIRGCLADTLGAGDFFEYLPPRINGEIWELYRRFDAMVFPSTSNLETLGRVLVEASYAGVPVVCGEHAAAPELVPRASLCPVHYQRGAAFNSHHDHCLGRVGVADMARVVTSPGLRASDCHVEYQSHSAKLLDLLSGGSSAAPVSEPCDLRPAQRRFIQQLKVSLPPPLSRAEADPLIDELLGWFIDLQHKGEDRRERRLAALMARSRFPERTRRYIEKSTITRCDFTNVGGIDLELCHVAGFYPEFSLGA
jgi:glycosyltransferase involved in cell wall biosynthesis